MNARASTRLRALVVPGLIALGLVGAVTWFVRSGLSETPQAVEREPALETTEQPPITPIEVAPAPRDALSTEGGAEPEPPEVVSGLDLPGVIHVHVLTVIGAPVTGAAVSLDRPDRPAVESYSDAMGVAEFADLDPDGTWQIRAEKELATGKGEVVLTPGHPEAAVSVTVEEKGLIRGRVVTTSGRPVAGWEVQGTTVTDKGRRMSHGTTDTHGGFELVTIRGGRYAVFTAPSSLPIPPTTREERQRQHNQLRVYTSADATDLLFELPERGDVEVRFVDAGDDIAGQFLLWARDVESGRQDGWEGSPVHVGLLPPGEYGWLYQGRSAAGVDLAALGSFTMSEGPLDLGAIRLVPSAHLAIPNHGGYINGSLLLRADDGLTLDVSAGRHPEPLCLPGGTYHLEWRVRDEPPWIRDVELFEGQTLTVGEGSDG